jgi:hypothetical protein
MVSKNLKIILGVLCALFLLFGCLGSGAENKQVNTDNIQVAAVQAEPVKTTAAATETPDMEWLRTSGNWCLVIGQDMDSLSTAAYAGDLENLYRYAKQAKGNIENAKKADSKLSPSAKYAYAHSEYLNSLEDIGNALDLIISCGDGGWTDTQKIPAATELMKSGNIHINNFTNALKTI